MLMDYIMATDDELSVYGNRAVFGEMQLCKIFLISKKI